MFSKKVYVATSNAAELDKPEPNGTFDFITASKECFVPNNL